MRTHPGDSSRPWAKGMRALVLRVLTNEDAPMTSWDIAAATGKPSIDIGPRLTELSELGYIVEVGTVPNPCGTGRPLKRWSVHPAVPAQPELFTEEAA